MAFLHKRDPSCAAQGHAPPPALFGRSGGMSKRESDTLSPMALDAMSKSLSLAATVLGFDIVELWSDAGDGKGLHCTFAHASKEIIIKHPSIIYGYYPKHDRAHFLSPVLCELCRRNETKYHWRILEDGDLQITDPALQDWVNAHHELQLPIKTEMAYLLDGDYQGANIFIVGLAFDVILFKQSKLRFLSGLGYAIYVAAFDFDDFEDDLDSEHEGLDDMDELDTKEFAPLHPLQASAMVASNHNLPPSASLANLAIANSAPDLGLGVWGKNISNAILMATSPEQADAIITAMYPTATPCGASDAGSDVGLRISPRDEHVSLHSHSCHERVPFTASVEPPEGQPLELTVVNLAASRGVANHVVPPLVLDAMPSRASNASHLNISHLGMALPEHHGHHHHPHPHEKEDDEESLESEGSALNAAVTNIAPTWAPVASFGFPVAEIPVQYTLMDDLTLSQLSHVQHLTDGSNANIFLGKLGSERVIIKMIKEEVQGNSVAMHEFDLEHGMLCRISHPNIIRVLGAGRVPRRFIVLEHLGGGSLNTILSQNQSKPGLAQRLFHKPTFGFLDLLQKARDMADALEYLHVSCHPGATIIHRDLKPDNVGFTTDGKVKLFDFGLSTCVRSRSKETDVYEMTGYTGSLRYMAPEVALRQPYTEKVDVYSFAIMLWQMARDRTPFKGFNKDIFMKQVVKYHDRPKLDSSWPPVFSELLTECWSRDPMRRPSFSQVKSRLDKLITEELGSGKKGKKGRLVKSVAENAKGTHSAQSSWF